MKITDYGLWFKDFDSETRAKTPKDWAVYDICLYGVEIGFGRRNNDGDGEHRAYISLGEVYGIGYILRPNAPGFSNQTWWVFPNNYIPVESDFQVEVLLRK